MEGPTLCRNPAAWPSRTQQRPSVGENGGVGGARVKPVSGDTDRKKVCGSPESAVLRARQGLRGSDSFQGRGRWL